MLVFLMPLAKISLFYNVEWTRREWVSRRAWKKANVTATHLSSDPTAFSIRGSVLSLCLEVDPKYLHRLLNLNECRPFPIRGKNYILETDQVLQLSSYLETNSDCNTLSDTSRLEPLLILCITSLSIVNYRNRQLSSSQAWNGGLIRSGGIFTS